MTLIKPKWQLYDIEDTNPEYELFDSTIVEFTDISGIIIQYFIRKETVSMDQLYGESTNTEYYDPLNTKIIYEVTEETTIINSFGISSEDMIQYAFMPKTTYTRDIRNTYDINPKPGDVIKTLWNNRAYEIADVGEEAHIFQLRKLIYEFILKPFRFSEQSESAKVPLKSPDSTYTSPITGYGDNEYVEEESDDVDTYGDVDTSVYGF